jgi:hypothetical protein
MAKLEGGESSTTLRIRIGRTFDHFVYIALFLWDFLWMVIGRQAFGEFKWTFQFL